MHTIDSIAEEKVGPLAKRPSGEERPSDKETL